MLDLRTNASLILDRGIDSITYAHQEGKWPLPERSDAPPSDIKGGAQLDLLLQKPSMDHRLDIALLPRIENRTLLSPGPFRAALGNVVQHMRQAAQGALAESDQRTLNRAMRLLKEESNLRDLEQMYRSALYQG